MLEIGVIKILVVVAVKAILLQLAFFLLSANIGWAVVFYNALASAEACV